MIKVRVLSRTAVTVGHRQLLPDEIHEVAGGDLNAAVVLYGADAFKILSGAPVEPKPVDGTDTNETTEPVVTSDEAAPSSQRNRRRG